VSHHIPSLGEAFAQVDELYVNAEYREIPGFRFRHDAKSHHLDGLTAALLMARHDGPLPVGRRRYGEPIDTHLARLRELAATHDGLLRDAGNEGCQYGPEVLEHFCRNVHRHLDRSGPSPSP